MRYLLTPKNFSWCLPVNQAKKCTFVYCELHCTVKFHSGTYRLTNDNKRDMALVHVHRDGVAIVWHLLAYFVCNKQDIVVVNLRLNLKLCDQYNHSHQVSVFSDTTYEIVNCINRIKNSTLYNSINWPASGFSWLRHSAHQPGRSVGGDGVQFQV